MSIAVTGRIELRKAKPKTLEEDLPMPKMGKYCKVYPIAKLREFDKWTEKSENVRTDKEFEDGTEVEKQRELTEADYLYLQEDYTVTDGIFIDENTIFADVTPEWISFCKNNLSFDIPVYETASSAARPVIEQ